MRRFYILGKGLAVRRLQPVEHVDTFRVAWSALQPETTVID